MSEGAQYLLIFVMLSLGAAGGYVLGKLWNRWDPPR